MRYVKHILLPGEQILYDGHVHPRVLLPGIMWLCLAAFILAEAKNTGGGHSYLLSFCYTMGDYFSSVNDEGGVYESEAR